MWGGLDRSWHGTKPKVHTHSRFCAEGGEAQKKMSKSDRNLVLLIVPRWVFQKEFRAALDLECLRSVSNGYILRIKAHRHNSDALL